VSYSANAKVLCAMRIQQCLNYEAINNACRFIINTLQTEKKSNN
jgi:hypothetical protein